MLLLPDGYMAMIMPDFLTHYYENSAGPFSNLSRLPLEHAEQILEEIRRNGNRFASQRASDYLTKRFALEDKIRTLSDEQWKRSIHENGKKRQASVYWRARALAMHELDHLTDLQNKISRKAGWLRSSTVG
jgi:Zn-dependent M16 (insulinase) family peptidase